MTQHRETVDKQTAAHLGIIRFSTDHRRTTFAGGREADDDGYEEEEEEEDWPTRLPTSARRYTGVQGGPRYQMHQHAVELQPSPRRASARRAQGNPNRATPPEVIYAPPRRTTDVSPDAPTGKERLRRQTGRGMIWCGLLLLVMIAGWIALNPLVTWWTTTQDDWAYGRPRTFQVDWNVGHGTAHHPESHFIAMNLNRHLQVIEIPGGDPSKEKVYLGPTLLGPGQDLAPVTLSFEDVNHDGRPDLVLHVQGNTFVFLNQPDNTFKPAPEYNQ